MRLRTYKFSRPLFKVQEAMNELVAAINENQIASGIGYRLKRTANGTGLEIEIPRAEQTIGTASSIQRMRIVTVNDDYLTCRKQMEDGTVDNNSTLFYVAKPHYLRVTILNAATIDGWLISISSPGNTRILTAAAGSGVTAGLIVTQKLNYSYSSGDTIYATQPTGKTAVAHPTIGGVKIDWLDLNVDSRNFHQTRIMLNACVLVGGVPTTKTIVFEAGPVP